LRQRLRTIVQPDLCKCLMCRVDKTGIAFGCPNEAETVPLASLARQRNVGNDAKLRKDRGDLVGARYAKPRAVGRSIAGISAKVDKSRGRT